MDTCTQSDALAATPLGRTERARFWRAAAYGGLECLAARFRTHRYSPHTHDTYVVGVIVSGCETYMLRGTRCYAGVGEFCLVNPGDVHDGEPHGAGYAYRMSYPSVALLRELAAERLGNGGAATPRFRNGVARDPWLARRFVAAHRALAGDGDPLARDQRYLGVMSALLERHAGYTEEPPARRAPGAVARAMEYLDAHYAERVDLCALADIAGLDRYALLRAFRRHAGLTPHAWLVDRRVHAARRLLAAGGTPRDTALACGFADQSHLTRAFKARVGVPPGRYRAGPGSHRLA